jgi:hypothetical protein
LIQSKGLQEGLQGHNTPEEQDSHLGVHREGPPHHRGWRVTSRSQLHHPLLDRVGPKYLNHIGQDRGSDLHCLEGRRLVHITGTTQEEDLQVWWDHWVIRVNPGVVPFQHVVASRLDQLEAF